MKPLGEKEYYLTVRKWLERKGYYCGGYIHDRKGNPKYYQDKGTKRLRIDVAGIKNVGNRVSNEIEVVAVEVRDTNNVSVRDVQDAHAYTQYAHKCYLATTATIGSQGKRCAEKRGIGLLKINNQRIKEVVSPQIKTPDFSMMMNFLRVLDVAKCPICGTFFEIYTISDEDYVSYYRFVRPKYFKAARDHSDVDALDPNKLKNLKAAYRNYGFICGTCMEEFFPNKLDLQAV